LENFKFHFTFILNKSFKNYILNKVLEEIQINSNRPLSETDVRTLINRIRDEVDEAFEVDPKTIKNLFNGYLKWSDNWGYLTALLLRDASIKIQLSEEKILDNRKKILKRCFDEYKKKIENDLNIKIPEYAELFTLIKDLKREAEELQITQKSNTTTIKELRATEQELNNWTSKFKNIEQVEQQIQKLYKPRSNPTK